MRRFECGLGAGYVLRLTTFGILALAIAAAPASAQDEVVGSTANSSAGKAGERQTREKATESIKPLQAVAGRLRNRIQSRIRNRIDREYDPQANTRSPFIVAEQKTRSVGKPQPR